MCVVVVCSCFCSCSLFPLFFDHGAKRDLDPESHEGSGLPWMREHDDEKFVEINDGEGGRMESPESFTVFSLKSFFHVHRSNNFHIF